MANNRPMTEDEKKLLQAQHRMEAIEARNRQKERNQTIDPDGSRIGKRVPGSSDYGA